MKAIVIDDEPLMIKRFLRLSDGIAGLEIVDTFEAGQDAIDYAEKHPVEVAFVDGLMPKMNGITVAKRLREIHKEIIIVFVSAYEDYLREFNQIGGDYYIMKPYNRAIIEMAMKNVRRLAQRQPKSVFVQTFGRFFVTKKGVPVRLTGKAKEILALIVIQGGKEISNEEIYSTIWENRSYSNENMCVYYNALRRLKLALKEAGLENMIHSTARGQMANIKEFDCDYYAFMENNQFAGNDFSGEFLSEYSWGEYILADIINKYMGY
ncbi:MAG: response regulator [Ruminococcus sp.]|nr:response regulator [Ruminococcus sp.]